VSGEGIQKLIENLGSPEKVHFQKPQNPNKSTKKTLKKKHIPNKYLIQNELHETRSKKE
jgi:hypothetical protein